MSVTYTFIIPHKDIPDLLQRCLDSIPQREDVQVIVVDDNSDPEKVDFVHFPGLDRSDVECYFTKEGKGAGYARNVGLKYAKGKWLLFADADDMFTNQFFPVIDRWCNSDNDLVYFAHDDVWDDKMVKHNQNESSSWQIVTPWAKMVRRDLFIKHSIKFDETRVSNDIMAMLAAATLAAKKSFVNEVIYMRIRRSGSLSTPEGQNVDDIWQRIKIDCRAVRVYPQYFESICWLGEIRRFGCFHSYKALVYVTVKIRSFKYLSLILKFQIKRIRNAFK